MEKRGLSSRVRRKDWIGLRMLLGFHQQLAEPVVAQLVVRIVVGHLAELGDAILQKLTHGCESPCPTRLAATRSGAQTVRAPLRVAAKQGSVHLDYLEIQCSG